MTMHPVGTRVGALLSADKECVRVLGYGRYVGDEIPPADLPGIGDRGLLQIIAEMGRANPKIVLDDGTVVYGAECWWGPEERIQQLVNKHLENGAMVVNVKPNGVNSNDNFSSTQNTEV